MNLRPCWLFGHEKKILKVYNYIDTSYGHRLESTQATWKCTKCGKVDKDLHYGLGYLSKEQLES